MDADVEKYVDTQAQSARALAGLIMQTRAKHGLPPLYASFAETAAPKDPTFGLIPIAHFVQGHGTNFGTAWRWGKVNPKHGEQGLITDAHVVEEWVGGRGWEPGKDRSHWPEFTKRYSDDEIILAPGGLDAALFGVILPDERPPSISEDMPMNVRGYPAGVTIVGHYETRRGKVYMPRHEGGPVGQEAWIMIQPAHDIPETPGRDNVIVIGGMSGGCGSIIYPKEVPGSVRTKSGWEVPAALLRTLNGPMPDGRKSHDNVELADVWDAAWGAMV